MLQPAIILILWTLIMMIWLYATRLPAMQKAKIKPDDYKLKGPTNLLPDNVRAVADNYNHLHEAPTIFYALCFVIILGKIETQFLINLAWLYVIIRIFHSLIQAMQGKVVIRFSLFMLSQILLFIMVITSAIKLF